MNSTKTLNYEIRPCKFVERRLLLSSLSQITTHLKQEYQYIGFGGVTFTDFKLFHKELNIDTMYSIEGGSISLERLEFNKPYSCITIFHGTSTEKLLNIDLTKPSIVWLDYDDALNEAVFKDIGILFSALPHGSVYIISCNRELKNNEGFPMTRDELENRFKEITPLDLEANCCADVNTPATIKRMIHSCCNKRLEERNELEDIELKFVPLYNITYKDGAKMFTFGGTILRSDYNDNELLNDFTRFLNGDAPLNIAIPNLTYKEALYFNQILNNPEKEKEVLANNLISADGLDKYKRFYKYMPNFYDVRI